jgi:hypothetical protein
MFQKLKEIAMALDLHMEETGSCIFGILSDEDKEKRSTLKDPSVVSVVLVDSLR